MQRTVVKDRKIKISLCLFDLQLTETDGVELNGNSFGYKGKFKLHCNNLKYLILDCRFSASDGDWKSAFFDSIYPSGDSESKFSDLVPYLNSFTKGRNVCVFTHGVTGMTFVFA